MLCTGWQTTCRWSLNDFWRVGSTKLTFVHLVLLKTTSSSVSHPQQVSHLREWHVMDNYPCRLWPSKQTHLCRSFLDLRLSINDPQPSSHRQLASSLKRIMFFNTILQQDSVLHRSCPQAISKASAQPCKAKGNNITGITSKASVPFKKKKGFKNGFTDLPFTIIIQLNGVFLKFCHQIICCHKSEVLIAWCHLSRTIRD